MKKPEPAKTGDLLRVVDRMPEGVWGYQFSVDPDRWLVPVKFDYEAAASGARDAAAWADIEVTEGRMDAFEWWTQVAMGAIREGIGGEATNETD